MKMRIKGLEHRFGGTYSIIGDLVLGINHATVCKGRSAEQVLLPFSHHHIVVLIESIIEGMEDHGKHSVWIFIRHPRSLLSDQAFIQGLEESADLVCVATCARQNYDSLAKV